MAGNLSSVDLSGLVRTAASQGEAVEAGHGHLNLAVSHAQTLSSTWTGEASTHFGTALSNFHEHGTKLLQSLSRMHELMNQTHSDFSTTHEHTTSSASGAVSAVAAAPSGLPGL